MRSRQTCPAPAFKPVIGPGATTVWPTLCVPIRFYSTLEICEGGDCIPLFATDSFSAEVVGPDGALGSDGLEQWRSSLGYFSLSV